MKRFAILTIAFIGLLPLVARAQSSSTPLTTFAALKGVALNQSDLIGYTLEDEHGAPKDAPPALIAAYFGSWNTATPTPVLVSDILLSLNAASAARAVLAAGPPQVSSNFTQVQQQDLGPQGVGDQDDEVAFAFGIGSSGLVIQGYQETARVGTIVDSVLIVGMSGAVSAQNAVTYARIIANRIVAAQGPSAAQPTASTTPTPQTQPAPASASMPIAPTFQPQGLVALAAQYITGGGYVYAGDCSQVTVNDAGAICTLMYGPDGNGNYTISYSVVGDDGTPEPSFGSQVVSPDQAPAPTATPAGNPAEPASSPSPVPVDRSAR